MIARPNQCDSARLAAMLDESLDLQEQFQLTEHLDHCESCQHELESLTARAQWWHDTKEILSDFDTDNSFYDAFVVHERPLRTAASELVSRATHETPAPVDALRQIRTEEKELDQWIVDMLDPIDAHPGSVTPANSETPHSHLSPSNHNRGEPSDSEVADSAVAESAVAESPNGDQPGEGGFARKQLGQIGGLAVQSVIGQGGMGVVLKAQDTSLNRSLAVKLLSPMLASNGSARQRFLREAQAAAAVVHPNIVPIYAVSVDGKIPYLVMPFIGGGNLQQAIDRDGPVSIDRALSIGLQVAEGLAAAHSQGIVHRDIKPANLMLDDGGFRVLLTDFGLARVLDNAALTASGMLAGTPMFMSPEQARGLAVDQRSDIYSLGTVLYTLVTGCPPVRGDSSLEMLRRLVEEEPTPIIEINETCPAWFARLVAQLMHKSVDDRVQSAEDACSLLRGALAHARTPHKAPLPTELQSPKRTTRYLRAWTSTRLRKVTVLTLLACTFVAIMTMLLPQREPSDPHESARESTVTNSDSNRNNATIGAMDFAARERPLTSESERAIPGGQQGSVAQWQSGPASVQRLAPAYDLQSPETRALQSQVPNSQVLHSQALPSQARPPSATLRALPTPSWPANANTDLAADQASGNSDSDPTQWETSSVDELIGEMEASLQSLQQDFD